MIVSNTTPISNLLHLNNLVLLEKLFGSVFIPEAVAGELDVSFAQNSEWLNCIEQKKIIVQPVKNTLLVRQQVPLLHPGEAEAICLALENNAALCLMDDKDGRTTAQLNNLPVTGTLGLLLKAKDLNLISSVKVLLDALREEYSFWIKEDMYHKVLLMAKE